MDYSRIGKKITEVREDRNLSQERLATKAHISKAFICQVEKGQKKPRLETLVSIAEALDTTVDTLLGNASRNARYDEIAKILADCNAAELRFVTKVLREICANLKDGKII